MTAHNMRCSFYVREIGASGKGYIYIDVGSRATLTGTCPPAVGDRVYLATPGGTTPESSYRVVDRTWSWPAYGSPAWRDGAGPAVDLIVERALGTFVAESAEDYPPEDEDEGDGE